MPVVVAGAGGDLIGIGLARTFARPGGNVTGLSSPLSIMGKSIQLLAEAVPGMSKVAVLRDASLGPVSTEVSEGVAHSLSVQTQILPVDRPDELDSAFAAATRAGADGLYVTQGPLTVAQRGRIVALAAEHRLPATYGRRV